MRTKKDADQSAHPRKLISTFVVRCLDSMICILAMYKVCVGGGGGGGF